MKRMFLPENRDPSKADYQDLLRRCGFGIPDFGRALWSVSNSLTMVVQESLLPFKKEQGKQPATRDMHLHNLPWPVDILEDLGETQVEMRVTLSYFIEPNPSQRGVASRYRYASHGLRFDVKRPLESTNAFRGRINAAARDEEEGTTRDHGDSAWLIGVQKSSQRLSAWRHLAGERGRACESRLHRRLPGFRVVEKTTKTGAIRSSGAVRLGCQYQSAGN